VDNERTNEPLCLLQWWYDSERAVVCRAVKESETNKNAGGVSSNERGTSATGPYRLQALHGCSTCANN